MSRLPDIKMVMAIFGRSFTTLFANAQRGLVCPKRAVPIVSCQVLISKLDTYPTLERRIGEDVLRKLFDSPYQAFKFKWREKERQGL